MVRPRLVQEGKPLVHDEEIDAWEQLDVLDNTPNNNNIQDPWNENNQQRQQQQQQQQQQYHHHHSHPPRSYHVQVVGGTTAATAATTTTTTTTAANTANTGGSSSLSQAAQGLSPIHYDSLAIASRRRQQPLHSYHVEIGPQKTQPQISAADHDDMMMDSDGQNDRLHHFSTSSLTQNDNGTFQPPQHHHYPQPQAPIPTSLPPQPFNRHQHHMVSQQQQQQKQQQEQQLGHGFQNNNHHHRHHRSSLFSHHHDPLHVPHRHHIEIGAPPPTERMEGVTLGALGPLVVMDGANLAYAYADALGGGTSYGQQPGRGRGKLEPNVMGIQVAVQYFSRHVRVLVVLPASYVKIKPRDGSTTSNAHMETEQWDLLQQLKQEGKLVLAPPTDDDDAYVLTIGLRECTRQQQKQDQDQQQQQHLPHFLGAYCLSNDLYRDAQDRNPRLREWLNGNSRGGTQQQQQHKQQHQQQGRISFAFVDMGQVDDHGERVLDIVPNPRHDIVSWIEQQEQQQSQQQQQQPHGSNLYHHATWTG